MTGHSPLVCIIVITFNGLRHLEGCLGSLRQTDYPNCRILLVDNASTDGSADYTRTHFPEVQVLRQDTNLGFAGGNNRAMEAALAAGAEHVVLLNDDTVILDSDWLAEAVALAGKDPRAGMIGFQLLAALPSTEELGRLPKLPVPAASKPVRRIDGCALFIRGALLRRIGLFDEAYFAYAEEDDIEARAKRTGAGLMEIDRRIYHLGGGTSGKFPREASYLEIRNAIRFSIKNRGVLQTAARVIKLCDIVCSPFPLFLDRRNQSHLRARGEWKFFANLRTFLSACAWNLWHLRETVAARRRDRTREQSYGPASSS
jgi:GT2 family glycosyltransferase